MASLALTSRLLAQIAAHGEATYPAECCGFLLGREDGDSRRTVVALVPLENAFAVDEQYHRFEVTPLDWLHAEDEAEAHDLTVIGVYHSHPDHPAEPSEFDREQATPWLTYLITTIAQGRGGASRAWRLAEDRSRYDEETMVVTDETT